MSNSNNISKGLKWNSLAQIINQVSVFISGVILMRLLEPKDFGLVAIVSIFIGFAQLLTNVGLSSSIINEKDVGKMDYDNVFSLSFFSGLFLSLLFFFLSDPLAIFFEDIRLKILFQIAAIALFISPLAAVPAAILKRKLLFKELAVINMCSTFIALSITIMMAINDYGYFSLIAQKLVYVGINVILLFIIAKYWPSIKLNLENLKKHLSYGLPILGSKIINYFIGNLDNFLIGKFMTPVSLGYYSRAFSLVTIPSTRIGLIINSTLFPVFSNMKNKGEDINKTVLILYEFILYVLLLLALLYIVNAKALITIISPDGAWDSIVPIIQTLAIVAIVKPIINFYSSILYSLGLSKKAFKIELFGGGLIVIGFLIGVSFSLVWFSYIYVISAIIFFIYYSYVFKNTLNLEKAQLFHLSKYKIVTFLIVLALSYLFFFNIKFYNSYFELSSGVVFVSILWLILNLIFEKRTTKLLLKSIKSIK